MSPAREYICHKVVFPVPPTSVQWRHWIYCGKAKIINGKIVFENKGLANIELAKFEGHEVNIEIKKFEKYITDLQKRAPHLWFTLLADALNAAGFDMKKVIREELDIKWTNHNVKEYLWRPTQIAMFGIESSTRILTKHTTEIYEVVDRVISERTGVHVDWPCIENLMEMDQVNER